MYLAKQKFPGNRDRYSRFAKVGYLMIFKLKIPVHAHRQKHFMLHILDIPFASFSYWKELMITVISNAAKHRRHI